MRQLDAHLQRTLPMGRIVTQRLPGCGGIRLGLIDPEFPTGPLPAEVMRDVIAAPAYWAFCWGSGLALARFLLDKPHWARGKRVVDLGAGSGVVAIAAAAAGAAEVTACDTDPDARAATAANARLNGVEVAVRAELPRQCDVLMMADVLYDASNLPLLETVKRHASEVLVADSRITELPDASFVEIAAIEALTFPNLGEFDEFNLARMFHWRSS